MIIKTKLKKQFISVILCFAFVTTSLPVTAFANYEQKPQKAVKSIGEDGGFLISNFKAQKKYIEDYKFNARQGHGFAAEQGNNLIDKATGKRVKVVGGDNAKNGADRMIFGRNGKNIIIQDKYYKSAAQGIDACFDKETGMFRYMDADGHPMKIEVPKDQYDDAVKALKQKISDGKIEGVTDTKEASNIIRKGNLTYEQAKNITKAGNIDSVTYDAANGCIVAAPAVGISFAIDYAVCKFNGQSTEDAVKSAALNGLKTGTVVFATYVISSQLKKITVNGGNIIKAMQPASEAVVKRLGKGCTNALVQMGKSSSTAVTTTAKATETAARVLSNQVVVDGVLIVVLTTGDVINLFRGRISKEQLLKNLCVTAISVGAGTAGSIAGGAIGSLIAPGAGTAIGSIAGGAATGTATGWISEKALSRYYEGDATQMYNIISDEFKIMADDYLINEDEGNAITTSLSKKLDDKTLKDMYASKDRKKFARKLMKPLFEEKIKERKPIKMPSVEEIRYEYKDEMQGIVFVH